MSEPVTKERLSRLGSLRREVTRTKRRLAELEERLEKQQTCAAEMSYAAARAALEQYLCEMHTEEAALLGYIQKIEDAELRELFMLRYYDGIRSWQRIAFLAGEHDESYVRRKHDAYLKKFTREARKQ